MAVVALILACLVSIAVGANPIDPALLLQTLTGGGTTESRFVVWDQRVPRTVVGLAVGAALGGAGALMQAFTRNPLADPGILGVNAGAAAAVAGAVVFLGVTDISQFVWFACGGAFLLTVVVYLIGSAGRKSADPVTLTLSGLAVGAVLSGLTTGLTLTNPEAFEKLLGWNAGSLLGRGLDILIPVAPLLIAGALLAVLVSPALNSVALGDETATSHGVGIVRARLGVLVSVTLLAGTATAIAGPISFVGLMIPHVVRWSVGPDQRRIVVGSLLFAPVLVLLSDVVGRVAVLPAEMPVGIVTAFVGAPILIVLVRRSRSRAQ